MSEQMAKQKPPHRIHLTSRCYVRGWAHDGQVFVQAKDLSEAPEPRNVMSVGWRPKWWGQDGNLRIAAETITRKAEDDSAPILREFAARWPLGRDDRAKLSQFIALHTVRTPAWRSAYEAVSIEAICDTLGRERQEPDIERAAIRAILSDQLQVDALLKQIPRLASLLMSMHWTLLEFDEPLIASGDQPVVCVPRISSGKRLPITAMPRTGFMETAEVRFPVDPQRLLLMTWSPQPDLREPVPGQFRHAADVNRSTREQADTHWFYKPGRRPPLLSPPALDVGCEPISYELVPGYSFTVARDSRRRSEAAAIMKQLIADNVSNTLRFVVVTPSVSTPRPPSASV
jgi:Protein of unknown function (DUF4238)